jgi:23S rRNA pseudouridine1911/1915/1917 synthase
VTLTFATDRGDAGIRVDRVLLRHLSRHPGITRNRVQRLIARGAVLVDGRAVAKPSARVPADVTITIELPERKIRTAPVADNRPLDIVYEDAAVLIVNKPPGQVSHPTLKHGSGTLLDALQAFAKDRFAPSLVGRLDRDTSGLVLVAKDRATHGALQRLAQKNAIEKDYLAIVRGKPPLRGTIDFALDRDPWDQRRVTVRDRGGVPSVTKFERLRYVTVDPDLVFSVVRCRLVTGRMHQIRVHLAAREWPIIGDATYGVKYEGIDRQALHAWRLAFPHPADGGRVEATAPLPRDMMAVLERLGVREFRQDSTER